MAESRGIAFSGLWVRRPRPPEMRKAPMQAELCPLLGWFSSPAPGRLSLSPSGPGSPPRRGAWGPRAHGPILQQRVRDPGELRLGQRRGRRCEGAESGFQGHVHRVSAPNPRQLRETVLNAAPLRCRRPEALASGREGSVNRASWVPASPRQPRICLSLFCKFVWKTLIRYSGKLLCL